ncbi:hypothetical protein LJB81_03590 [Desulfovibrio sp. OttesenSCG-928-M14]|nr:hypothetical protein [Desulfovibrio sp. OttesenSCG-928-M14]
MKSIKIKLMALCGSILLCSCAAKAPAPAVMALSLDGPPLAVAGEYAGMELEGSMDRTVMAGTGALQLEALGSSDFACTASVDSMPTQKARVRGFLNCTGGRRLPFSLRNTGPDQGVGIARESAEGELLVLFYHPSPEEAKRRLPEVRADMDKARTMAQ